MKFVGEGTPKTLLPIRKYRIIDRILGSLAANSIANVRIVIGYRATSVMDYVSKSYHEPDFDLTFVYNPCYQTSNTAFSLWLASAPLGHTDTIIVNGDVIINEETVRRLVSRKGSCLCCLRRKCGEEEVKVSVHGSTIISLGKKLDPSESWGEYVGLAKFSINDGQRLRIALQNANSTVKSQLFYDDVINQILNRINLSLVDVSDLPIAEIDTQEDLAQWTKKFGGRKS